MVNLLVFASITINHLVYIHMDSKLNEHLGCVWMTELDLFVLRIIGDTLSNGATA